MNISQKISPPPSSSKLFTVNLSANFSDKYANIYGFKQRKANLKILLTRIGRIYSLPNRSCILAFGRIWRVLMYSCSQDSYFVTTNSKAYLETSHHNDLLVSKDLRTWISVASSDISASFPWSCLNASSNSSRYPAFAWKKIIHCNDWLLILIHTNYKINPYMWCLTSHLGDSGMKMRPTSRTRHGMIPTRKRPAITISSIKCSMCIKRWREKRKRQLGFTSQN